MRGAPHLHRTAELPRLAGALWPRDDADATARISTTPIREGARMGVRAVTAAATAMHEVVHAPMPKGELSAAVTARVPGSLSYWCTVCAARHISGALFQQAGVFAGVRLEPDAAKTTLAPLGTRADAVRPSWPDDLVPVDVDGRRAWAAPDTVDALRTAPAPRLVRLLPPADPYLQGRDRSLLVPDPARAAAVWSGLAKPGAVLVDGEIAGTWRARLAGKRLDIAVTPFDRLDAGRLSAVDGEAARIAAARGAADVRVIGTG